jgi:hypothetical protein
LDKFPNLQPERRLRVISVIRPWRELPDDSQARVLAEKEYRFFGFPALPPHYDDSYLDFRRLTTVTEAVLTPDRRLASLTDELAKALREAFVRFITQTAA